MLFSQRIFNKKVNYLLHNKTLHKNIMTFTLCINLHDLNIVKHVFNKTHDMHKKRMEYFAYNNLCDYLQFFHLIGFALTPSDLLIAYEGKALDCVNYMICLGIKIKSTHELISLKTSSH